MVSATATDFFFFSQKGRIWKLLDIAKSDFFFFFFALDERARRSAEGEHSAAGKCHQKQHLVFIESAVIIMQ